MGEKINMISEGYLYRLCICGVLSEHSTDLLLNLPGNRNEKLDLDGFPEDGQRFVYFLCTYSGFEIQTGTTFNILFDRRAKEKLKIDLRLVKVYLGYPDCPPLNSVPHGWKTACKFSVSDEYYAMVKEKIPETNSFGADVNFELRKYEVWLG